MALSNAGAFAMYVIGISESSGKWDAINFNDPITVGIMQWFGTRAAALLNLLKDQWSSIAASLRASLEAHDAGDGGYWPDRWLTPDEGYSLKPILSSAAGKAAQQQTWESDYAGNVQRLARYGFSEANPKPMILLMSALHQSPKRAITIAQNYGGASSLDRIYQAIRVEPVLGKYMKHRYTPTYEKLKAWDGVSAPPGDWGGVTGPYVPPGDDQPSQPTTPPTGEPAQDQQSGKLDIHSIVTAGDLLVINFADGRKVTATPTPTGLWKAQQGALVVTADQPPPVTTQPDTPQPPTPPTDPGKWAHPCPARKIVSSEWGMRWGAMHRGIDFAAPHGTPIYAVESGTVIKAGSSSGFGYAVGIRHPEGMASGYGHMPLSSIKVKIGDTVTKGQQIAAVGSEGQSTGPHLHFEIYSGGQWASGHVNPRPVLEAHGVTP